MNYLFTYPGITWYPSGTYPPPIGVPLWDIPRPYGHPSEEGTGGLAQSILTLMGFVGLIGRMGIVGWLG